MSWPSRCITTGCNEPPTRGAQYCAGCCYDQVELCVVAGCLEPTVGPTGEFCFFCDGHDAAFTAALQEDEGLTPLAWLASRAPWVCCEFACRREALPGADYCAEHLRRTEPLCVAQGCHEGQMQGARLCEAHQEAFVAAVCQALSCDQALPLAEWLAGLPPREPATKPSPPRSTCPSCGAAKEPRRLFCARCTPPLPVPRALTVHGLPAEALRAPAAPAVPPAPPRCCAGDCVLPRARGHAFCGLHLLEIS